MRQFYELVRELVGLGKDMTEVALAKAGSALLSYFSFLKRVSVYFGLLVVLSLTLVAFGTAFHFRAVVSLAMFLCGVAVFLWFLAAFPIVWAVKKGLEWESLKKSFEFAGVATLWIFFLSIYFYLVPVPLSDLPIVFLLTAAMALASVLFGVGLSTKFIALRLWIVFTVMTISFVLAALLPNSFGGVGKLVAWADESMSGAMTDVVAPPPKKIEYRPDMTFFDPRTSKPLIWYGRGPSGDELFAAPGFHPQSGVKLEPVTPEKVEEFHKLFQEREAKLDKTRRVEEQRAAEYAIDALRSTESVTLPARETAFTIVAEKGRWTKTYYFPPLMTVDFRTLSQNGRFAIKTQSGVYRFTPEKSDVAGVITEASFMALSDSPEQIRIRLYRSDSRDTISTVVFPDEPLAITVPPGFRVDVWGKTKSTWSEDGLNLVLTLTAEKETAIKYRLYLCTALMPCGERPIVNR